MILEYFFISVTILYFLTHLYLRYGLFKSIDLERRNTTKLPKVSLIVAGRNESENIARCINSLSKTDYPADLLEIILVDDNSTDNTFDIMCEASKEISFVKVVRTEKSSSKNLKGKANAIDTAIKLCKGDIIISTDADCEVQQEWVWETVKYFSDDTVMVCGFTIIKTDKSIFSKLQCLDWMYLLTLASSSSGLKMILSCIGNNLSFSKNAYNKVGGYSGLDFSVTEDLALMRKFNSDKKFTIKFPVNKECIVETLPCRNIPELMSQKRRWFRGGTDVNALGYLLGFELFTMNILLLTGFIYLSMKIYLVLIIIKLISEIVLMNKALRIFNLQYLYRYYPLFSIYFASYGLFLPLSFLTGKKIRWKGREF